MSDDLKELRKIVKDLKGMRRRESVGKILRVFGNAFPKGIRHPDSLVRNLHLYKPGMKGKTILK